MALTPRALEVLREMAAHKDEEDGEIACEGRECWLGDTRIHRRTVNSLLGVVAIKDDPFGQVERYVINETGEAIARRPVLADEIAAAIAKCTACFTIRDDKLEEI